MGTAVKLADPIVYKKIKMVPGELTGRGATGNKKHKKNRKGRLQPIGDGRGGGEKFAFLAFF